MLNNVVQPAAASRPVHTDVMETIPHRVREFGIEARKPGRAWEAAFNGPIQSWTDPETGETLSLVTVRLSRLKDPQTRELYSTNLLFYMPPAQMQGIQNVYDLARTVPFTRIRGPRTLAPLCSPRPGKVWYDPNPEGVIMEDIRQTPVTLPDGRAGFFVTGQGYRGKVIVPDGHVIHDVGVYGGYLDPQSRPAQLELKHLFGGIEFAPAPPGGAEEGGLTEIADGVWVRGIVCRDGCGLHVESYKNSVRLPCPQTEKILIGARSMSETKRLAYFESTAGDGLSGFRAGGVIEGLAEAVGPELWERVYRVGLGSNFIPCPELGGYLGFIHVVLEKNNPAFPQTHDPRFPGIHEQYEGWVAWLDFDGDGAPVIRACVRAITPDDVPSVYQGAGELFDGKRVAFPISLERREDALHVGYGWGDRALFQAEFNYQDVTGRLAEAA